MRLKFVKPWKRFKPGEEIGTLTDGVATTLIRVKKAVMVEDKNDVTSAVVTRNGTEPSDSGDRSDIGTSDAGRGKEAAVSGGGGHKPGRRTNQPNSSRS